MADQKMAEKRKRRERTRRGSGTIYERRTKTLGLRYVIMHSYVDLQGKRHRPQLSFATRAQAENASTILKAKASSRGRLTAGSATQPLDVLAQKWLHAMTVESGTRLQRDIALRKHILPYIGRHQLIELTADLLDRWKNMLRDCGVGPEAQRNAWTALRTCLQYATDLRLLPTHPMHGLRGPKKQRKEIVPFTDDEIAAIFQAARGHRYYPILQLLYSLAMRQGELLGLKWSDIDFVGRTVTIGRQALDEAGKLVIKEKTKTKAGMRTLALTDDHLAIFESRRLNAEDEGLWPVGYNGEHRERPRSIERNGRHVALIDCEWVFPVSRGERHPLLRGNLRKFWGPLLKSLKIRHRGMHHFRHTATTQMLLSGVSMLEVAGILGHSKPATTVAIYSHVMENVHGAVALAELSRTAVLTKNGRQASEGHLDGFSGEGMVRPDTKENTV